MLALALVLALACAARGERANGCPVGEACSPSVRGLAFVLGRGPFTPYGALAVGGIESVRVVDLDASGGAPSLGAPGTSRPFRALSADPSILSVTSLGGAVLEITGVSPGIARLRIVDANGLLLDSLPIAVDAVARERLQTATSRIVTPNDDVRAIFAGRSVELSLGLLANDGTELYDGSILFDGTFAQRISIGARASGAVVLDVTRGVTTTQHVLPIVTDLDEVVVAVLTFGGAFGDANGVLDATDGIDIHVGVLDDLEPSQLCAVGRIGLVTVAGIPIDASSDDPSVSVFTNGAPDGCALITPGDVGSEVVETDVHLTSLDRTATVHVRVHPGPDPQASPLVSPRSSLGAIERGSMVRLGERAR